MFNFIRHTWAVEIIAVLLFTLFLQCVETLIYRKLHPHFAQSKNIWDDNLLRAVHRPFLLLIWIVGFSLIVDIIGTVFEPGILFKVAAPIREVGTVFAIVWFLVRLIRVLEQNSIRKHDDSDPLDKTTVHAFSQILVAAVVVIGCLVALEVFNIPIGTVLAFGGIGGIAVGFASKDLLGNFFGGLMIYLDRPFNVGDWIRSTEKNIEGDVEHIGWRLTKIRTFEKRLLYVPNGVFSTICLENVSRMSNRRIKHTIGVRYEDAPKIPQLLEAIENMLHEHPEIDSQQVLYVRLIELGSSSLNFVLYAFTKTTHTRHFQSIQQDVLLKTLALITEHGAQCPYPIQTLHLPENYRLTTQPQQEN